MQTKSIDYLIWRSALGEKATGKELDAETGNYYYGAMYLDPKTSRWLSTDPAIGEYVPGAPVNDEARKRNGNLPGMGGVFNVVNFHLYHYAGNNPVKYTDPDGKYVEVTRNGNNINLVLPVQFTNAKPEERAEFIAKTQAAWSGKFGDYTVTLTVVERSSNDGRTNTLTFDKAQPKGKEGTIDKKDSAILYVREPKFDANLFGVLIKYEPPNKENIYAHETGHLMNLDHSNDKTSVMYPSTRSSDEKFKISKSNIDDIIVRNRNISD